jgi:hypothetical protein
LIKHQKTFKELYPCDGGEYFEKAIEFFYDLEHDKTTSLHSPIFSSNFSNISLPFTKKDEKTLLKANKLTIASILQTRYIGSMILYLPIIKPDLHNTFHDLVLINKLSKVVEAFKPSFPTNNQYTVKKANLVLIPLGTVFEKNKKIFAFHFKRLHRDKYDIELPAIKTRQRDNLYFPDKEMFSMTLHKLFKLPIILHFKNFYLEQINRTLSSKNKLFKWNLSDSNLCAKCNIVSTTEHALLYCIFPTYFIHKLAIFLDLKFNDGKPNFIFLKENFYLYNMYFEEFSENIYLQLSNFILAAKDRSLKFSKEENISKWNENTLKAHTLILSQFTFKLLQNAGQETDLISDFLAYIQK